MPGRPIALPTSGWKANEISWRASRLPLLNERIPQASRFLGAALCIAAVTVVSMLLPDGLDLANIAMIYLLGVVVVAVWAGKWPSIFASILSVAAVDFFFVHPYFTLVVADTQYLITFCVMLLVALIICELTTKIREQFAAAQERESRTAMILAMAERLSDAKGEEEILSVALGQMNRIFDGRIKFLDSDSGFINSVADSAIGEWYVLPIAIGEQKIGAIAAQAPLEYGKIAESQKNTLQLMTQQLTLALERWALRAEQQKINLEIETERIKNALLSSVSHDLRTPLAAIAGAASLLMDDAPMIDERLCRSLAGSIFEESQRLNRIIENLVCATRIESGQILISKEWVSIEEVIGTALKRLEVRLEGRHVLTEMATDLPLIKADGLLLELAIVNIIENAIKHTPPGSPIRIQAGGRDKKVVVEISDQGAGIVPALRKEVFKRFFRSAVHSNEGIGLGLYICAGIVHAHGGSICADNSLEGGALFTIEIPASDVPDLDLMEAR